MGDLGHDGGFCTTHEPHYSSENDVLKNNPTEKENKKRSERLAIKEDIVVPRFTRLAFNFKSGLCFLVSYEVCSSLFDAEW